ncbi:hypothetical protein BC939DRAFT_460131 [Gamsiella multidivaricata]|uniref:uncharacterized protein n=1 Tax=Gamsiella multidivaricata TaxID=101098 RepID=UPI0022209986|nr:uncharacterized protein BC939DRAFT_460131 [Gamsiella multidivaricata]KAI7819393.1 hypothetical protein BC939DRAFT_460131 [Gamsiella multidivaricata]
MDDNKVRVLIVGAGLGGLVLAILLEKAGIPYLVFERAIKVRPLGSAMFVNCNILPFFEQLGIYDDVRALAKQVKYTQVLNHNMEAIGGIDASETEERSGYPSLIVQRPELYDLLLKMVPKDKVHMNHRVLSIKQDESIVKIRFSDNSEAQGDVLVGADGVYSAVRQSLFRQLQLKGELPKSDQQDLTYSHICLVGTTLPADPARYPMVLEDDCKHTILMGDKAPYSLWCFTIPGNRICWNLTIQLKKELSKNDDAFRNSEWGPEATESMCNEVKDFKSPYGGTLGDLIDITPKDLISKVMLEDKLFQTWTSGRVVLMGDACHKMLLSGGQGAINAMQDAIVLSNNLNELRGNKLDEISAALKHYQQSRYRHAEFNVNASKQLGKALMGQTMMEEFFRRLTLNYIPKFLVRKMLDRSGAYRPQSTILPSISERGIVKVLPQAVPLRHGATSSSSKCKDVDGRMA